MSSRITQMDYAHLGYKEILIICQALPALGVTCSTASPPGGIMPVFGFTKTSFALSAFTCKEACVGSVGHGFQWDTVTE